MNPFVDDIVTILSEAAQLPAADVAELLAVPPDDTMGDYALPCFTLAKVLRKNPAQIATDIATAAVAAIDTAPRLAGVQAAGPYVNVRLDKAAFIGWVLDAMREQGDTFGAQDQGRGRTVAIDFASPNLARPRETILQGRVAVHIDAVQVDEPLIRPAGQCHPFATVEQLEARLPLVPAGSRQLAEVGDPLIGKVRLHDMVSGGRVEALEDGSIGDGREG